MADQEGANRKNVQRIIHSTARALLRGVVGNTSISVTAAGLALEFLSGNSSRSLDERIRRIDTARDNLTEALVAIDELKASAQEQQKELEELKESTAKATGEKERVLRTLEDLKTLGTLEQNTIRAAFGIPKTWQVWLGYFISFLVGIATTVGYDFFLKGLIAAETGIKPF